MERRTMGHLATTTKNVKKLPGEKGQTIRKSKMLFGVQVTFLIF